MKSSESDNNHDTVCAKDDVNVIDIDCKDVTANIVLELTKDSLNEDILDCKYVKETLVSKAQIILKLLNQGHKIQIIDITK